MYYCIETERMYIKTSYYAFLRAAIAKSKESFRFLFIKCFVKNNYCNIDNIDNNSMLLCGCYMVVRWLHCN